VNRHIANENEEGLKADLEQLKMTLNPDCDYMGPFMAAKEEKLSKGMQRWVIILLKFRHALSR